MDRLVRWQDGVIAEFDDEGKAMSRKPVKNLSIKADNGSVAAYQMGSVNIQAGRDVCNNVIVTGHHNTVNHKVDYRGMTDRDYAEWERRNVRRTVHAGWVFLALIIAGVAWKLLAVVGAVVLLVWMMIAIPRYLWKHWTEPRLTAREQRRIAHRDGAAQLAARADLQNHWYLQGDLRGTYGPRYTTIDWQ